MTKSERDQQELQAEEEGLEALTPEEILARMDDVLGDLDMDSDPEDMWEAISLCQLWLQGEGRRV